MCGDAPANGINTVNYAPSGIGRTTVNAADRMAAPVPCGVTFANLYVRLNVAPGGVTARTLTLWVNGVASALAVTITGAATTGQNIANAVHLNAGDTAEWRATVTGAPAASRVVFAYESDTDNAADAMQWGMMEQGSGGVGVARAFPVCGGISPNNGVAENNAVFPAAVAGTISAVYAFSNKVAGSDNTRGYDMQLRLNSGNVGAAIQLRGATVAGNVTGLSTAFAVGDLINATYTSIVGGTDNTHIAISFCYQPTTGVPMFVGCDPTGAASGSTQYAPLSSGTTKFNAGGAGDPQSSTVAGITPLTLQGLYVRIASGLLPASSVTYQLYSGGVGALTQLVTISTGATSGQDNTHTDQITVGTLLEMRHTITGSGSGAAVGWSFGIQQAQTARLRTLMGIGQ